MKTELEARTLDFALRIIAYVETLPKTTTGWIVGRQLVTEKAEGERRKAKT